MLIFSKTRNAGSKPKTPAKLRSVYDEAARVEREMQSYLVAELKSIRADISLADLTAAVTSAKEADIFAVTDVGSMRTTFRGLDEVMLQGARAGARIAAEKLGRQAVLDVTRAKIKRWVREHSAELVSWTMGTTKSAVRRVLAQGIEIGRHPVRLAKDIRSVIGLTEPQAAALIRHRDALAEQGLDPARVNALADKRADQMLTQRAQTIARTESLNAVNQGRASLWDQLVEDGAMPADQMQEWDATLDGATCPECAGMHGQRRKVGEMFESPSGIKVLAPTLHASCRCVTTLVRGE